MADEWQLIVNSNEGAECICVNDKLRSICLDCFSASGICYFSNPCPITNPLIAHL